MKLLKKLYNLINLKFIFPKKNISAINPTNTSTNINLSLAEAIN